MIMTKGSFFIGVCILAGSLIISISLWSAIHSRSFNTPVPDGHDHGARSVTSQGNEPLDAKATGTPPSAGLTGGDTSAVDPRPIAASEITGTLEIDVHCLAHPDLVRTQAWLFIDGELQGRLPVR